MIVDDDPDVRHALTQLFAAVGYEIQDFASAEDFLDRANPRTSGCAVVDLRMTGMSGLQLLDHLRNLQSPLRCVLLTGHGDIPSAVTAVRGGAVQFLEKPCPPETLLEAVEQAIRESESPQALAPGQRQQLLLQLTPDEQDVFRGTIAGLTNSEMADKLDVSLRTVQLRRSNMMRKLGVQTRGELLHRAWEAGFTPDDFASATRQPNG